MSKRDKPEPFAYVERTFGTMRLCIAVDVRDWAGVEEVDYSIEEYATSPNDDEDPIREVHVTRETFLDALALLSSK